MSAELQVYLDGEHIGSLVWSDSGNTTCVYGRFREEHDATPLSLSMLTTRRRPRRRAINALISRVLDGVDENTVARGWLERRTPLR